MRRLESQGGWTLFELVVVLAIISISAAVAVPSSSAADHQRAALAAEAVAHAFRFARDESLRTGSAFGVDIDDNTNRIRVFRADTTASPPQRFYDVFDPVSRQLWDVDLDTTNLMNGASLSTTPAWRGSCPSPTATAFMSAGTPACAEAPGSVVTTVVVTVNARNVQHTVTLDGVTGRVRVQ